MITLATARASVEIFGRETEKEDIFPVEFIQEGNDFTLKIKKTEFIAELIKKSGVFAVNVIGDYFEKKKDLCEMLEGRFIDKFKKAEFEKEECRTIDAPCIKNAQVLECEVTKEDSAGDKIAFSGKVLTTHDA